MKALEMFSSKRQSRSEGEGHFRPYRYNGPTGSVFGDLISPEVFVINFLPKTPEEQAREHQRQMAQWDPVGAALARAITFDLPKKNKPEGENEFSKIVIYQEKGAEDMLDFIHRVEEESRFRQLKTIKGFTNIRMASYAIKALGFDIQRDYYGEDATAEGILAQSKEAEASLIALSRQARKMKKKKEREAFLKEHNIVALYIQSHVKIAISKYELLTQEEKVRALHDRLLAHKERNQVRGRRGILPDKKRDIGLFF